MPVPYFIPADEIRRELVVVNSRFIATLAPVASMDEARAFIARVRAEFQDPVRQPLRVNEFARAGDAVNDFQIQIQRIRGVKPAAGSLEAARFAQTGLDRVTRHRSKVKGARGPWRAVTLEP